MSFLSIAAPLASAFLGYRGAQSQANQQAAQNRLLQQNYAWQKAKETPGVTGAQNALQSNFQPFVDLQGRTAVGSGNVAQQYLANVPHYQQAGLQGLGQLQANLATTPDQQIALGQRFADPYASAQYNLLARDANERAGQDARRSAIQQGRFGALSSQAARAQGEIERQRTRELGDIATRVGSDAFRYGQDAGNRYLSQQAQLGQNLLAAGTSGLSQAQQASQLGTGAAQAGIQAPFLPFQQYGQTVSAQPSASVPQFGTVTDPFSTGAGLGLQAYNLLNPQNQ